MSEPVELPTPPPSEGATWEDFQRYKAEMRAYDRERIARGLATPEQVQRENAAVRIPPTAKRRILKYPDA